MSQNSCKVSVIVPVYNTQEYLSECLESILSQTLADIEVIVLNDGSTDQSMDIINEYASRDSRVVVESHSNVGLGPTRNIGVGMAKGQYLAFVDSDDLLYKDALENLYESAALYQSDIVAGQVLMTYPDSSQDHVRREFNDLPVLALEDNNRLQFYKEYYLPRIYSYNACDKLYRREFVIDNNIVFGDNKKIFAEDNWFQLQAIINNPTISFVNKNVYKYRQQENSIMHKIKPRLYDRQATMVKDYYSLITNHGFLDCDLDICYILAAETLVMEVLDQLENGGNYADFKHALSPVKTDIDIREYICNVKRSGAYLLFEQDGKKRFYKLIATLYCMNLIDMAHWVVWKVYKVRF